MYTFQGVKVTKKRFWELSEIAKDLLVLEKELDKEVGRDIDQIKVKELILEAKESICQKHEIINCSECGSKLVLSKSKWGPYLRCSNILNCKNILVVK